ncbi:MAG: efflux RND transporter periplasmic adaptor subunit [Candidatus Paceibacterota bacterium]
MKKIFIKTKDYILKHKIISVLVLIVIIALGYWLIKSINSTDGEVSYITEPVKSGSIITTVSGTGQVSALNQVDLKTKTSGDLIYLNAKVGQEVQKWAYLAGLNSGDASYELESAQIAYDELVTLDPTDLQEAEEAVIDAKEEKQTAYDDGRITIIKSATDLSDSLEIIDGLFDTYLSSSKTGMGKTEKEYIDLTEEKYYLANKALATYQKNYRLISDKLDDHNTEIFISDLNDVAKLVLDASKTAKDTVVYMRDREDDPSIASDAYVAVNDLVISANSIITDLTSADNNIVNGNRALRDAETTLSDLKDGPDTLDLRSQELALKQKKDALSDYSVTAPFAGIIASVGDVNLGETLSSGTTIATLITKQKMAEISLNEIDAAKVQVGQKAELTFDAFEELKIVGTVAEVNLIGTVSQGVVSYTIKIGFDSQDERVKPGMSVSASITTDSKTRVLIVPNSAIKNKGTVNYVEILTNGSTRSTPRNITVGISNDTVTEIIDGLSEGDRVVTKTVTGATAGQATSQAPSVTSILGGGSGTRMPRQ